MLHWFQGEVERQCSFAVRAFEELEAALNNYERVLGRLPFHDVWDVGLEPLSEEIILEEVRRMDEEEREREALEACALHIWFGLQNFLVAVGNVSKLLWPPRSDKKSVLDRRDLRKSLSVEDDSVLRCRELRNHLEHFDERLDQHAASLAAGTVSYYDLLISPVDPEKTECYPTSMFRHFDPEKKTFVFQGKTYELRPILDAARELKKAAASRDHQLERSMEELGCMSF